MRESVSDTSTFVVPDQDRQLELVEPLDLVDDRVVLLALGPEDQVVPVVPDDRAGWSG